MAYVSNEELADKGKTTNEPVQLKPQNVKLQIRPNSVFQFQVDFRQAEDYPLDLYYLMDLSRTMLDDKTNLELLGTKLANTLSSITSKLKIGFGSFVDKTVMPFTNTMEARLKEPCNERNLVCAPPYGYRNDLPLSANTSQFSISVKNARISGNLDNPEGGLDALMQAIVCEKEIGWRSKSRKVIVLSTDATFHQAGDGLLGGIVKPNDMKCHLNSRNEYSEGLNLDYPSVGEINYVIKKNNVNVIFAVTRTVIAIYEELTKALGGAASFGELDRDSSNVINLVVDQYNKITSSVELRHNASSKYFSVYFHSSCLDRNIIQRNICRGLKVKDKVTFSVEIVAIACPKERKQTIQIQPVGLNEVLLVQVEVLCDCECEQAEHNEPNSPKCHFGNGTYECGICNCNKQRFGNVCECGFNDTVTSADIKNCIKPGENEVCSKRGSCVCALCECDKKSGDEKIYGKYCECDNYSCDRYNGKICNGATAGSCQCGDCKCNPGFRGQSCECRESNMTCIGDPSEDKLCSGHGNCDCGSCVCNESPDEIYRGEFCEDCQSCPKQCTRFKDCVQCLLFKTGPIEPKDCNAEGKCGHFDLQEVDKVEIESSAGGTDTPCYFMDSSDGCFFTFKYSYNKDDGKDFRYKASVQGRGKERPIVTAQKTKNCPEGPNTLAIVLGTTGGIVALGVALLVLWKILAVIHDNKEYAKFEEERKKATWNEDENPLYTPSTSVFQNPTFDANN